MDERSYLRKENVRAVWLGGGPSSVKHHILTQGLDWKMDERLHCLKGMGVYWLDVAAHKDEANVLRLLEIRLSYKWAFSHFFSRGRLLLHPSSTTYWVYACDEPQYPSRQVPISSKIPMHWQAISSLFFHPVLFFLLEHALFILIIGFTSPTAMLRPAVVPLIVACTCKVISNSPTLLRGT